MIHTEKKKKVISCPIPDFFAEADSDTEAIAMEAEYISREIADLSREINKTKEFDKRMELYDKRECYIKELKKRPEQLQAATKVIL